MDAGWQGKIFNNQDRLKALFEKTLWTDVQFAFHADDEDEPTAGKQILKAHKLILANASEVFEKMFYGILTANADNEILIEDFAVNIFSKMLKYIYTNAVEVDNWENYMEIFRVANFYMLHALQDYCVESLLKILAIENVLQIYEFAQFHEISILSAAAMKLISLKTEAVIRTNYFNEISNKTLADIVKQEKLQTNEADLFVAVQSMAKKRGAIQNVQRDMYSAPEETDLFLEFREIIKQIRFLSMTDKEFSQVAGFSALLTGNEPFAISTCLTQPELIEDCYPKVFWRSKRQKSLPHVYFDIVHDGRALGRIVMELRTDVVPKSAERFRDCCVGTNRSFKGSKFLGVLSSCIGQPIDLQTQQFLPVTFCEPENFIFMFILKHDSVGVLGAYLDKDRLQQSEYEFYITFHKIPHCDNKTVTFGKVIEGFDVLEKIKAVPTKDMVPLNDLIIENCGEL